MTGAQILIEQGRAEGEAKGRAEGRAEGEVSLLLRLLHAKFGALPADVEARVQSASLDQLDLWAHRFVTAATLDELFLP